METETTTTDATESATNGLHVAETTTTEKLAVEAQATEPAAVETTPKPDGAAFAALKRREKRAVEAEKRALELESRVTRYQKALESNDPDALMEAFGVTGDKLVDLYVKKHAADPAKDERPEAEKKLEELERRLAEREKADSTARANAVYEKHMSSIREAIAKGGDKYELIAAEDAHEMVFAVQAEYHRQHNTFLTNAEAMDAVEQQLETEARARLERLTKVKKLQGKTAATAATATAADKQQSTEAKDPLEAMRAKFKAQKRITNGVGTAQPTTDARPRGIAAADARLRERVAALQAISR